MTYHLMINNLDIDICLSKSLLKLQSCQIISTASIEFEYVSTTPCFSFVVYLIQAVWNSNLYNYEMICRFQNKNNGLVKWIHQICKTLNIITLLKRLSWWKIFTYPFLIDLNSYVYSWPSLIRTQMGLFNLLNYREIRPIESILVVFLLDRGLKMS